MTPLEIGDIGCPRRRFVPILSVGRTLDRGVRAKRPGRLRTGRGALGVARILCVEDEAAIRKIVVEELQDAGHETLEAADGEEAMGLIERERPDLILCDISIPKLNGFEVLRRTRALGPEFRIVPFLFLSALADPREIIEGQRMGADEYITKPIHFDELFTKIERRLERLNRLGRSNPT